MYIWEAKIADLTRLNGMLSLDGEAGANALKAAWKTIEVLEGELRYARSALAARGVQEEFCVDGILGGK